MQLRLTLFTLFLSLLLSNCHSSRKATHKNTDKADATINPPSSQEKTPATSPLEKKPVWAPQKYSYNPSRTKLIDIIHTKLEVNFLWDQARMNGKATLTLKPWFHPQDSVVLDAKGFDILNISLVKNNSLQKLIYKYNNQELTIQLDKKYSRDEAFQIVIEYIAKPEELKSHGGSDAITDDKGLYFINYDGKNPRKPKQIWTQGETQSNSCWFPTIDSPNERTTQEMYITVDQKYKTLSNGILVSSTQNPNGTRTDYWKMDFPHAPYLFMMAVGEFSVIKDSWRGIEVSYYVEKEYEPYARLIFGNTPEMIEFFSTKLGVKFAWPKYSQIVVRDFVSGAMENTSATVHSGVLQHDAREHLDETHEDIISHELFHHWFGDLVTCESWSNLPLNESFATYGEYLWIEHKYGKQEADLHLDDDLANYLAEANQKREPLIRYYYKSREDMFDGHSYQKGGRVLHVLRNYLGDDAFFAGLKLYLAQNAFSDVEIDELRMAFEEICGEDLHWFFDQWFLQPGHPELSISYTYDTTQKQAVIYLKQAQNLQYMPVYRLPVYVSITENNQVREIPVTFETKDTTFKFPTNTIPQNIVFDSKKILLARIKEEKTQAYWLFQAKNGANFKQKQSALANLSADLEEEQVLKIFVELLDDPFWAIRLEALDQLQTRSSIPSSVLEKIKILAQKDPKAAIRKSAMNWLVEIVADKENSQFSAAEKAPLKAIFSAGLSDSSYSVMGAALTGLYLADSVAGVQQAEIISKQENSKLMSQVAEIYFLANHPKAYEHAIKTIEMMDDGYDKFLLISLLGSYLHNQDEATQNKGLNFLKDIAKNNPVWWMRLGVVRVLAEFMDREDIQQFFEEYKKIETNPRILNMLKN